MKSRIREDDIELLLPTFRERVRSLLARMRALDFSPILFDGLRTPEEALRNSRKKTGIVLSMHLYGCAADIICEDHLWSCQAKKCKFYTKLGQEAGKLGLHWGGSFGDMPHVQALPFRTFVQDLMRALGTKAESSADRDALCVKHLGAVSAKSP
jgi:hypothetical protein